MSERSHYVLRHGWGFTAITLGAWEAVAFTSGGRCPTITTTVARARARNEAVTRVLLAVWTAALLRHLFARSQ